MVIRKSIVHLFLLTLAALEVMLIATQVLDAAWISGAAPALMMISALWTCALLLVLVRQTRQGVNTLSQAAQLRQEVEALNHHALVSLTDKDGNLTYVNRKLLVATGYTEKELLGRHVSCLYFDADKPRVATLRACVDSGGIWQGESLLRTRGGEMLWTNLTIMPGLDDSGRPCGAISVRTDITAAKAAQAQNDVFKALDRLIDEVLIFDAATLRVKYINSRAKQHRADKSVDPADMSLTDFDASFAGQEFRDQLTRVQSGSDAFVDFRIDRNACPYDVRMQMLQTDSSRQEVMVVMRDMSHQVEREQTHREFISTVSHELRSPMTSIKGSMGLLLANAGGELPGKARTMLEIAHRNADRLVEIINDLLDIEKISSGNMSFDMGEVNLDELIDEAMLANQHFAARFDVKVVRTGLRGGTAYIDFDRSLQVLTNLLSNAAKFSPPGGKVVIHLAEEDDAFRISVQDFGRGIAKGMQDKVFEKFLQIGKQSDMQVRGTGLGLAIVKAIAEQQGGTVSFESVEGKGTTFFTTFPKAVQAAAEAPPPALQAAG